MKHLIYYGFILVSILSFSQEEEFNFCKTLQGIEESLKMEHYRVPTQDTAFATVFANYILEDLDPSAYYLTNEDRSKIKQLISAKANTTCNNIPQIKVIYQDALGRCSNNLNEIKGQTLSKTNDAIYHSSFQPIATDLKDFKKLWKNRILLKSYRRHLNEFNSKDSIQELTPKILDSIKLRVIETEICKINALQNEGKKVEETILNAYAQSYDPHSNYFSTQKLESFEDQLSDVKLSFGISFRKNRKGEIVISGIAPGSSAWQINKLNEGDILRGIITEDAEHFDFSCISLRELSELLQKINKEIATTFKFQKNAGEQVEVKLLKEEINVNENIISSFVLNGEKKLGYIYLPSFYTNENDYSYLSNGCANDLAKELIKLKREGIEGLVLDLRNNGGGSMLEAIRLVGSFINYGGISIVNNNKGDLYTLKDMSRGVIFNQPLIVMVNQFSASASELFASAIQDQNRGLVVGSTSFGKSTIQNILPVQYKGQNLDDDFIKVTTGAFYRINGGTHQNMGVIPDIEIPNIYKNLPIKESKYENSLILDSVHKKTYYYPLKKIEIEKLRESSKKRVLTDSAFIEIKEKNKELIRQFQSIDVPCNYEAYINFHFETQTELTKREAAAFKADKPEFFKENLLTAKHDEIILQTIEEIQYDAELNEAYLILIDLINQTQNK